MKRKLALVLMLLLAFTVPMFGGCSPSAEELIREDLTGHFEKLKSEDEDLLALIGQNSGDSLEQLGINVDEFVHSALEGFDYAIDEVVVDDRAARADVTLTIKPISDILQEFQIKYAEYLVDNESADSATRMQQAGAILLNVVDGTSVEEQKASFTYSQDDEGIWHIDDDIVSELTQAMM